MTSPSRRLAASALAVAALTLSMSAPAHAAPKPAHYKNCTALNKVYPHGVGRSGAKDKTASKSSKPVTNFTKDSKTYSYNDGPRNKKTGEYDLDRDNDGVACEKH